MGPIISLAFVAVLLSLPAVSAAQGPVCGGHRIHWIGGAPPIAYDLGRGRHGPPVRTEPDGMRGRRDLWDALVFNAYDYPTASGSGRSMRSLPLEERWTLVIDKWRVSTIKICIQSADESFAGERLAPYTKPSWWAYHIKRFTALSWDNTIQVSKCAGDPPPGWIYVREGTFGEVRDGTLAYVNSWRYYQHGTLSDWNWSEIIWNPKTVRDVSEDYLEYTLAHELGHVLGLWHVPRGSGFVMVSGQQSSYPDTERWLAQWAYHVGPNVQYPGLCRDPGGCRETPVPALPLVGVLVLAGLLVLLRLRIRTE